MTAKPVHVAFVCLHGSAKSVLAAEYLNRAAVRQGLAVQATASGREPDDEIPSNVVDGLRGKGFDVGHRKPEAASAERFAGADVVVSFGCDLDGLIPGMRTIELWSACPAVRDDFEAAWQFITARVERLLQVTKPYVVAGVLGAAAMTASAATFDFDRDPAGTLPADWTAGVTGKGSADWKVKSDDTAPSRPNVLRQSGKADFSWCVRKDVRIADGFVETRFKAVAGSEDRAGGLVWRFQDGDNYYVARANALENNVSLYYAERGRRKTLKYVDAPVPANTWHTLRVEFAGSKIRVVLNGKAYIEMTDEHIKSPGAVGLWTKADSVTDFDDFTSEGK
jgi:hypothetical protein